MGNNLPVLDQATFPPLDSTGFTLIAELPMFMDDEDVLNVELDGVVNWTPVPDPLSPTAPELQLLIAKTPLDAPIEETLALLTDTCPEMEANAMTAFKFVDLAADGSAVYRIYGKAVDDDIAILPTSLYSITATEFG